MSHSQKAKKTIAFIQDERVQKARTQILQRIIQGLKVHFQVELLTSDIPEERLLQKAVDQKYALILAPWYRYFQWKKIEGHFGLGRNDDPLFCGYFADQLLPHELNELTEYSRLFLLDYTRTSVNQAIQWTLSLLNEESKTGITSFLEENTKIYWENWYAGETLEKRLHLMSHLLDDASYEWRSRINALRICVLGLWNFVYEEGIGKENPLQVIRPETLLAQLQFGSDSHCFSLNLTFTLPGSNPRNTIEKFWPNPNNPLSSAQILLRHSDAIRIHTFSDTQGIEVSLFFFSSAPSEKAHSEVHTICIEPLPKKSFEQITEKEQKNSYIKLTSTLEKHTEKSTQRTSEQTPEKQMRELHHKIQDLKQSIREKDEMIHDLKTGGIGHNKPLPPPEIDSFLDAFQQQFHQTQEKINEIEEQIKNAEKNPVPLDQIQKLQSQLAWLTQREEKWIQKLSYTLKTYRLRRPKAS